MRPLLSVTGVKIELPIRFNRRILTTIFYSSSTKANPEGRLWLAPQVRLIDCEPADFVQSFSEICPEIYVSPLAHQAFRQTRPLYSCRSVVVFIYKGSDNICIPLYHPRVSLW